MDDVGRLVADLDRFLDELGEPRARRRPRVEQHVRRLTAAQRLRLAGALHLLSGRLDGDLAHPDVPSQGA